MGKTSTTTSIIFFIFCISSLSITITTAAHYANWLNHGGDLSNRRYAEKETKISPLTASKLHLKWKFFTGSDVTATPAIYKGNLYFPSWDGYLYAVRAKDGSLIWKQNVKELTGLNTTGMFNLKNTVARATPTIAGENGEILIIGIIGPAYVIAVKRSTGNLIWATKLDSHYAAIITMSGTYYKGGYYTGVSSLEEATATTETCCTFRGSFVKLDVRNGVILWRTYTLPDNQGKIGSFSGASIWGSSPSIDVRRNHVYIGTGNLYSTPLSTQQCQQQENNRTVPPSSLDKCIGPDIHSESVLALDLNSGKIKWSTQLGGYDVWFLACIDPSTPNCPIGPNPDADFGEAPMLLSIHVNGIKRDVAAIVQKSGVAWMLDCQNGKIIWSTVAGPGGLGGGGTWGAATDGKVIYTNIGNTQKKHFILKPSNKTTTGGGWVAMNGRSGKILWSTAVPNNAATEPVTIANGVVFAGSMYSTGPVYAIDASTGKILWSYETGAIVYGGMSVSNGCIFVGHGYTIANPTSTPGTHLFAFCVR